MALLYGQAEDTTTRTIAVVHEQNPNRVIARIKYSLTGATYVPARQYGAAVDDARWFTASMLDELANKLDELNGVPI